MDSLVSALGNLVANTIKNAIENGKSRKEALDEAAAALRREDVVSDKLWADLDRYIKETRDFEEHGSSG